MLAAETLRKRTQAVSFQLSGGDCFAALAKNGANAIASDETTMQSPNLPLIDERSQDGHIGVMSIGH